MSSPSNFFSNPGHDIWWRATNQILDFVGPKDKLTLYRLNKNWSNVPGWIDKVPKWINRCNQANRRLRAFFKFLGVRELINFYLCSDTKKIITQADWHLKRVPQAIKDSEKYSMIFSIPLTSSVDYSDYLKDNKFAEIPCDLISAYSDCKKKVKTRQEFVGFIQELVQKEAVAGDVNRILFLTDLASNDDCQKFVIGAYLNILLTSNQHEQAWNFAEGLPDLAIRTYFIHEILRFQEVKSIKEQNAPIDSLTTEQFQNRLSTKIDNASRLTGKQKDQALSEICDLFMKKDLLKEALDFAIQIKSSLTKSQVLEALVECYCKSGDLKNSFDIARTISIPYYRFLALFCCYKEQKIDYEIFDELRDLALTIPEEDNQIYALQDLLRIAREKKEYRWAQEVALRIPQKFLDLESTEETDSNCSKYSPSLLNALLDGTFTEGNSYKAMLLLRAYSSEYAKQKLFNTMYRFYNQGKIDCAINTMSTIVDQGLSDEMQQYAFNFLSMPSLSEKEIDEGIRDLYREAMETPEGFKRNVLFERFCRYLMRLKYYEDCFEYSDNILDSELQSLVRTELCRQLELQGRKQLANKIKETLPKTMKSDSQSEPKTSSSNQSNPTNKSTTEAVLSLPKLRGRMGDKISTSQKQSSGSQQKAAKPSAEEFEKIIAQLVDDASKLTGEERVIAFTNICQKCIDNHKLEECLKYSDDIEDTTAKFDILNDIVTCYCEQNNPEKGLELAKKILDPFYRFQAFFICYQEMKMNDEMFNELLTLINSIEGQEHKNYCYEDLLGLVKNYPDQPSWRATVTSLIPKEDDSFESIDEEDHEYVDLSTLNTPKELEQILRDCFITGDGAAVLSNFSFVAKDAVRQFLFNMIFRLHKEGLMQNVIQTLSTISDPNLSEEMLGYAFDFISDTPLKSQELDDLLISAKAAAGFKKDVLFERIYRHRLIHGNFNACSELCRNITNPELRSLVQADLSRKLSEKAPVQEKGIQPQQQQQPMPQPQHQPQPSCTPISYQNFKNQLEIAKNINDIPARKRELERLATYAKNAEFYDDLYRILELINDDVISNRLLN